MKETLQDLLTRRSCRKYRPEQISSAELDAILEAGTYAPTGMGKQSPVIVAVQNKADRDELSSLNAKVMGRDGIDPFYGAPTVVVVLVPAGFPTGRDDGNMVIANLLNAAHAVGVDSCYIYRAREVFEMDEGKALLKKWGIEGDYVGVGNVILGYGDEGGVREAAERKAGYIVKV
ncbi:MAG: nitroreductase family protein [Oscillospiraceae bacterium]|nr:nitroreductase family protein [Oscillospiraceae bacterium]